MQKVFNVAVDIGRKLPAPAFEVNTNDLKSVKLIITITNGQTLLNLTDTTVRIAIRKPDNHIIFQDCTVKDATNGQVEIILENQAYIMPGTHTAEIMCYKGSEVVAVSGTFSYKSTKGIMNDEAVESKSEFTAINQKIEEAKKLLEDVAEGGVGVDEQARQDIQEVSAKLVETEQSFSPYSVFEAPLASNEWTTTDVAGRVLGMNASQFLSLFYEPLLGTHKDGYTVSKVSLGKDQSGTYDIYEYTFSPSSYSKTILLSSGMHPFELPASFGLAHFMNHLMATPYAHSGFKYLRENVRIKVIPIVNPWGFSQNPMKYGNSRGVNINRNFDSGGRWATFPVDGDEFNKKGSAPFSEAETVILRDWATTNKTAAFWIDYHTGLNAEHADVYYHYISQDANLTTKLQNAQTKLENRIRVKYDREPISRVVVDSAGSIRQYWSYEQLGLSTFTQEGVNSWGTDTNNDGLDITEYEVSLSGYIFEILGINTVNAEEFQKANNFNLNDIRNQLETHSQTKVDKKEEIEVIKQLDVVLLDRFNRKNRQSLGNAETGQEWKLASGAYFEVTNGKAVGNDRAFIETGISDLILNVDVVWYQYAGVHVRYKDNANNYMIRMNSTGIALYKSSAGTSTLLKEHTFSPVQGKMYQITVVAKGDIISVYLDNVLVLQASDNQFINETKIALRSVNDYLSTYDNLMVRKILSASDSAPITSNVTLQNGWTGTVICSKDARTGLVSLRGTLTVGTLGDSLAILTSPYLPSYGHTFNCYKVSTQESLDGFYLASSNGMLYARKPINSSIAVGDALLFNTVYHS